MNKNKLIDSLIYIIKIYTQEQNRDDEGGIIFGEKKFYKQFFCGVQSASSPRNLELDNILPEFERIKVYFQNNTTLIPRSAIFEFQNREWTLFGAPLLNTPAIGYRQITIQTKFNDGSS